MEEEPKGFERNLGQDSQVLTAPTVPEGDYGDGEFVHEIQPEYLEKLC